MKELLSSAEFAKLCNVQKRTLFYYDEIDLLKPFQVNEKGYRIYHQTQFDDMSMIKAMQSIGMSLSDIKNLSATKSGKEYQEILEDQIKYLHQKQLELENAKNMLEQTNLHIHEYFQYGLDSIFCFHKETTYLLTHTIKNSYVNFINSREAQTLMILENDERLITCHPVRKEEKYDIAWLKDNMLVFSLSEMRKIRLR